MGSPVFMGGDIRLRQTAHTGESLPAVISPVK